ncbi:unnamed protein product [Prunus armeniaca]
MGFKKGPYEHTLFIKHGNGDLGKMHYCLGMEVKQTADRIFVGQKKYAQEVLDKFQMNDLIYTGNDKAMIDAFKKSMMKEFDMSDLGLMHYFLGIEVEQIAAGVFISQKKYAQMILDRFEMKNCNSVSTLTKYGLKLLKHPGGKKIDSTFYKQIMGSLMYLTATRPDMMHAVSLISRYMEKWRKISTILGFTDSDHAGDLDDRKSTSSYVFMIGAGAVSWSSKKQQIVTLSTTEVEFVAATSCACQAIWLKRMLEELHCYQEGSIQVFCDNSSAIKLLKNPVLHGRSKHIDVRYHFLRDLCTNGVIDMIYCRSEDQVADILTKPLKVPVFVKLRELLGVCSFKDIARKSVCFTWSLVVSHLFRSLFIMGLVVPYEGGEEVGADAEGDEGLGDLVSDEARLANTEEEDDGVETGWLGKAVGGWVRGAHLPRHYLMSLLTKLVTKGVF